MTDEIFQAEKEFLSAANSLKYLDFDQAQDLRHEQNARRRLGLHDKVENLAIDLGLLTPSSVQVVHAEIDRRRKDGQEIHDIFGRPENRRPTQLDSIRVWIAATILPAAAVGYALSKTVDGVVTSVHVWVGFSAFFEVLRPIILRARREWMEFPLRLAPIGVIASFSFMAAHANKLRELPKSSATEPHWQGFLMWLAICFICGLVVLARAQWRKRRIRVLEIRLAQMRRLEKLVTDAADDFLKTPDPDEKKLQTYVERVLSDAAQLMQLNAWDGFMKRLKPWISRWKPALGEVCAWYLTPSHQGDYFTAKAHAAPGASPSVNEVLRQIRDFRPAKHDVQWCRDQEAGLRKNLPKSDEEELINSFVILPDREKRTSLAGYAYANRTTLTSSNPQSRRYFNKSFAYFVEDLEPNDPVVRDWLDVTAYAAGSVNILGNSSADPHGVIVIWKNALSPASFSRDDRAVLATATRVLSGILHLWRNNNGKT